MRMRPLLLSIALVAAALSALAVAALAPAAPGFVTGQPGIDTSRKGAVLEIAGLLPGETRTSAVDVENTGTAAGRFSLTAAGSGDERLLRSLRFEVAVEGTIVYAGRLAGLKQIRLATVAAGDSRRVSISVSLPAAAGNELQGLESELSLSWTAAQD